jgi:hypothetical protein
MGQKSPDTQAIPLCARHHLWEYAGSYHRLGRGAFELRYGLDVDSIIGRLRIRFVSLGFTRRP